ncbi:GNAT family N-acetyltransferase [Limosilactobacillus sp. STM2_1]|uniref:GNAT family N-acetyltransferase n=1 Tax=Limosilactobacillus rudii TaxID=2759755 RepID=A0A7W3YMW1_9LACO|nr:GNAT family N-acetyltransferase [Limosilactobacillus rudii]MBB1079412.1 GNAT family N-acetyltransferase [Limosilactobacillus rudii]MBB1097458.1 GNAT family N-acetyltransferase [Limosilactobacillus rudii]MCD7134567.1 GNAT family N-acetyltransferase [Limosilactobacillus rudii]
MAKVGVLIGSLSKNSYSRKVADYFTNLPSNLEFVELNYTILPFYNPDLEKNNPPIEWQAFRKATDSVDALLIVTQEYNYSIPGGLKNALDVLSVPSPNQHLMGKPVLAITDSAGEKGGIIANAHIHQVLRYLGMRVMNCTIAIGNVQSVFKNGENHDANLAKRLIQDVKDFESFINESQLPHQACIDMGHEFSYSPNELALLDDNGDKIAKIILNNVDEKTVVIEEVKVNQNYRGQGLANKIMTTLMWLVEGADRQVKANCPFAKSYLKAHPQFQNIFLN